MNAMYVAVYTVSHLTRKHAREESKKPSLCIFVNEPFLSMMLISQRPSLSKRKSPRTSPRTSSLRATMTDGITFPQHKAMGVFSEGY